MKMLTDKRSVLQCLGCVMKEPSLLESYSLTREDFSEEPFHELIFSAVYNLYLQNVENIDPFAIDSYLSHYPKTYKVFEDNNGIDYCEQAIEISTLDNFDYYYKRLKKYTFLRFLKNKGYDITKLYDYTTSDPSTQEKEEKKLDEMSVDDMIDIIENDIITNAKIKFSSNNDSKGQLAGSNMMALKESLKEVPEFGLPLQSPIMTTVARGARLKKLYLRSSGSGFGKSRTAMADMCNLAVPWLYNLETEKWEYTGNSEPTLFISTELQMDELQTMVMAYVSGVNESKILDGLYEKGEEQRINQAIEYIESAPLYFEFLSDFGIQDIVSLIKKYKREKGCHYFCFDYIHMSARLISEVANASRGMKLREDQILFLFIDTLKNICNDLGVFILTMTQLNGTYKDSTVKDETMLRGTTMCL